MKKEHYIRTALGMTQEEIAMLLGISRARWGMFEIGKRTLPVSAHLVLHQLLDTMQNAKKTNKRQTNEHLDVQQHLERRLREIDFQLEVSARATATLEKKQGQQFELLQCSDSLKGRDGGPLFSMAPCNPNSNKLYGRKRRPLTIELTEQQIKQELLAFEKQLLESKIKDLKQDSSDVHSNHK